MNYIKQLEAKNAELTGQLDSIKNQLTDFLVHLNSAKFQGNDSSGERKDWIATADVIAAIREARQVALTDERKEKLSQFFRFTEAAGRLHGQIVRLVRENSQSYLVEFESDFRPYKKGDTICIAKYEATRMTLPE